jgi:hypothetical protein
MILNLIFNPIMYAIQYIIGFVDDILFMELSHAILIFYVSLKQQTFKKKEL